MHGITTSVWQLLQAFDTEIMRLTNVRRRVVVDIEGKGLSHLPSLWHGSPMFVLWYLATAMFNTVIRVDFSPCPSVTSLRLMLNNTLTEGEAIRLDKYCLDTSQPHSQAPVS